MTSHACAIAHSTAISSPRRSSQDSRPPATSSVEALILRAQDDLFLEVWAALSGDPGVEAPHRHLEALEDSLAVKHRSGPRLLTLPARPTPGDIRVIKRRYNTIRGTYRAFIGAMGNLVFAEALGQALARWIHREATSELLRGDDSRCFDIWPSWDKFESSARPEAHYWHPAAIQGPWGPYMAPDHRLGVAVIQRNVLIPKDRALYRLRSHPGTQRLFQRYLPELQAERVALRDWLQIHAGEDEGGAPSLPSWRESIAGLPSETVASTLHILHPWLDAVAEHPLLFDSMEELQFCTLQNSRPLFHAPAGLTHKQLQWLLGKPPRPAKAMREGVLTAVVGQQQARASPRATAVWQVGPEGPDMNLALLHPARCGGLLPIPLTGERRLEAIGQTYRAFMHRFVGRPDTPDGKWPLTPIDIGAFLSVLEMGILFLELRKKMPRLKDCFLEDSFPRTRSRGAKLAAC